MWPQQCNEAARKKRKLEAESGTVACGTHHNNGNPVTIFNTSAWPLSSNADLMGAWNETHVLSNFDQTSCWDAQAANPHFQHQQYQPSSEVYQNTSDMFNIQSHVANMVYHPHLVPMPTPSAQYNFQLLGGSAWTAPEPAYTTNVAESFDNTTSIINEALSEALQDTMELDTTTVAGVKSKKSGHMNIDDDEIVCFGVIGGIGAKYERPSATKSSAITQATILSADRFILNGFPNLQGHISADHSFLLRDMLDSGIDMQVRCSFESSARGKHDAEHRKLVSCRLDIAIYAPFAMLEEIKGWSEHNELYLQDPTFCLQDAKYCNPQRLSMHFDTPVMVSEVLPLTEHCMRLRSIADDDDFLDKYLASKTALQETEQPSAIRTALKSHQKQALTFMLRREKGWGLHSSSDMWSILDNANGRFYINEVSRSGGQEPPPEFCGGVIADPMGLGKTLTMIALAATDLTESMRSMEIDHIPAAEPMSVSATLIIVPPPLLRVWETQISDHVFDGALKFTRHHAKSRVMSMADLTGVDVVLTTYHTVSAEWSETGKSSSLLFSVKWKRIVLDEAHIIRNETSRMSKAMCSLEAECRWAVTGTPIQNHLNDLASLLKFIRAHPYESRKQFEADISDYWKDGNAQEAAKRLQVLSSCLFLRRPKSTIKLPPRFNKEYPVDFTPREREEYDFIKNRATSAIDDALQQGLGSHRSGAYANILQQIESLRLFCGLGLHYYTRHDEGSIASHTTASWDSVAQKTFKLHLEMGSLQCSQCHATIDLTQTMFDDATAGVPLFSRCLKFVCAECAAKLARRGMTMPCGHSPSCPTSQVSTSIDAMDQAVDDHAPAATLPAQMPSKIIALISDLQSQPPDVKSVVFSTWRLTLNVVAAGLEQAGIPYLRFDGSIPQKDRHEILDSFKNDPLRRVLLLTFSCGAVGLTLTEASRAYLLEPHWNPTIEEQALGRIYRIGQEKEVTTVRLFVRDSFETHVMNVQQSKKDLAQVILAPHDGGLADATLEKLQKLRSLL